MHNNRIKTNKSVKKKNNKRNDGYLLSKDRRESRLMPLEFVPNHPVTYRRRYSTTGGVNTTLKISDLLNSKIMAVSAILGYTWNQVVKLKRVQIWAPVTTQGTAVFITLSPIATDTGINSFNDIPIVITDESQAIDRVAYVDYKTKSDTPSGQYHFSTAIDLNLISIVAPAGSIMDLDIEAIENPTRAPLGYTTVLAGATIGQMYARTVASSFFPVGVSAN